MSIPAAFEGRLALPAIAAPMFLVSGPELVIEACRAGVIGTFPALNQRSSAGFDTWLAEIREALIGSVTPFGVNLIVHRSNSRVDADLGLCVAHKVPLVITSLGAATEVVDAVHGYGGLVFHDVTTLRHAEKAAAAGVDGLILVCAGAGGHAGTLNPFAFLPEVRRFFSGTIVLAGAISDGRGIAAARMLGADLAYLGTRFIATYESLASEAYKRMILDGRAADIVYTPAISGIPGSFLKASIRAAGLDPDDLPSRPAGYRAKVGEGDAPREGRGPSEGHGPREGDAPDEDQAASVSDEVKAWKRVWSAGQGVGAIHDVPFVRDLVRRLIAEYRDAVAGAAPVPA